MRFPALVATAVLFVARYASATCATTPSATHICVRHDGIRYGLDVGDGAGFVDKKPLTVEIGVPLELELDPDFADKFNLHPLYITDSSVGAGLGKAYTQPQSQGTITWTPTDEHTPLYYQCSNHASMGARIDIDGADAAALPPPDSGASSTSSSSSSSSSGASSTSSGGPSGSSASSGSSSGGADAGSAPSSSDDGGCNTSGAGAGGLSLAAVAALVALRRRRRH